MNFHILTLFPEMVLGGLNTSIIGRALKSGLISLEAINIRDFSNNKFNKVDDYTYGGGAGMLMQAEPVYAAYKNVEDKIKPEKKKRVIYVTPQGYPFTQKKAKELAQNDDLIFLCGHYEGIDERVLEEIVTDYVSIGDYVLTGGELPAMVMIDAISRLVPGVLHNEISAETESFHNNLLEYPQYSRPEVWRGKKVPEVILSGNTKEIEKWRLEQSIIRTKERRSDLYVKYEESIECIDALKKNKINYADIINLFETGRAEIIHKDDSQILVQDIESMNYFYVVLDEKAKACDVLKLVEQRENQKSDFKIVCHDKKASKIIEQYFRGNVRKEEYNQLVYTQKNRLTIKGMKHPKVDVDNSVILNQEKVLAKANICTNDLTVVSSICVDENDEFNLFDRQTILTALINYYLDLGIMPIFWMKNDDLAYYDEAIKKTYLYVAREKVNIFFIDK
nr:tRNA (guanosine(37)-N1)-methyltransferase TrmD [Lachnobacterium bovis]